MKKFFAVLATACLVLGMAGCQQNNVSAEQDVQDSIEIETAEMKTIESPENGWTLEDLLSVTYIYGNQITSPYTLECLGSNFTFDKNNVSEVENGTCSAHLYYKNMPIAAVSLNESNSKKVNSDTLINTLSFSLLLDNDNKNNIIVNGVDFNCNKKQVISSLGEPDFKPDYVGEDYCYVYYEKGTENRILTINFDSKDNVMLINICFVNN